MSNTASIILNSNFYSHFQEKFSVIDARISLQIGIGHKYINYVIRFGTGHTTI